MGTLLFWIFVGLVSGVGGHLLMRLMTTDYDEDEPNQLPGPSPVPQLPERCGQAPYRTADVPVGQPLLALESDNLAPPQLIRGLFTPPEIQLAMMRAWARELYWNFTDEDFEKAAESIPKWPDGGLIAVVLVPFFKCQQETFETLWKLACWTNPDTERSGTANRRYFGSGLIIKKTDEGDEVKRTAVEVLRWGTVDLRANRGMNPTSLEKTNAGAAVLAAAVLHPAWVQAMDGETVPYVWLPGYSFKDGQGKNTETPRLSTRVVRDQGVVFKGGVFPWRGDLPGTERRALVLSSTRSTNTSYSFAAPEYFKR